MPATNGDTANNSDSDETSNLTVESMAREVAAFIATCRMRWCPSKSSRAPPLAHGL